MLCWKICIKGEGFDGHEPGVHMLAVGGVGLVSCPAVRDLPLMLSSQASCVIVSGFRAALDLPLRNLIRPQCAERA